MKSYAVVFAPEALVVSILGIFHGGRDYEGSLSGLDMADEESKDS